MGRSLRIPGSGRSRFGSMRASEIRALAADGRLDRRFEARGPLVNRLLLRRIRSVLRVDGVPLPSVAPRGDARRARAQEALAAPARSRRGHAAVGRGDHPSAWSALCTRQRQALRRSGRRRSRRSGRLFVADYRVERQELGAPRSCSRPPCRPATRCARLFLTLSGRLARARALLAELVDGDLAGVHATGIAVHNLVRGFERMRELWSEPRWRVRSATDAVVAQCLFAPPSVLRQATDAGATVAGAVRAGHAGRAPARRRARAQRPGRDVAFMAGSWAHCPAAAFVPALLRAVWERALAEEADEARS